MVLDFIGLLVFLLLNIYIEKKRAKIVFIRQYRLAEDVFTDVAHCRIILTQGHTDFTDILIVLTVSAYQINYKWLKSVFFTRVKFPSHAGTF